MARTERSDSHEVKRVAQYHRSQLKANFKGHCIPFDNELWREDNYQEFLGARMDAMAMKLEVYYKNL